MKKFMKKEKTNQNPLTKQDKVFKKLDIFIARKKMRDDFWERKKKGWAIIIKSLKKHNILSSQELEQIAQLEIF